MLTFVILEPIIYCTVCEKLLWGKTDADCSYTKQDKSKGPEERSDGFAAQVAEMKTVLGEYILM